MTSRLAALWLVVFAVYAATLGLRATDGSDYAGLEPVHLATAASLVEEPELERGPQGVGFPALVAPAYAIGGDLGVELFVAALAALAVVLAYLLAARVVPDPWAGGATLAVALSPPFLAHGTSIHPDLVAGGALAGAALLALRLDERVTRTDAFGCMLLLGTLPWLGLKFVPAGVVIGVFAVRALFHARRRTLAIGAAEVALFSVIFYITFNEAFYDGPTPYSALPEGESATGAEFPGGYADRLYRLAALLIDREFGLLRWAPVFALAGVGLWLLARTRRDHLSRLIPAHTTAERAALLCALAVGAHFLVAAFLAPTMFGVWFPPRHLLTGLVLAVPLVAWGLRRAPRAGTALAVVGLVASVWLYADVRWGEGALADARPAAPWGPLERALPSFAGIE